MSGCLTTGAAATAARCWSPAAAVTTAAATRAAATLTIYSGREEEIVEPLFEQFEEETGIEVEVRYGDSAELAATIAEEGDNSPADVFFAQDAGLARRGGERGPPRGAAGRACSSRVDERFRDPDGRWVGTSGRARVVAYNTEALSEDELPDIDLRLHRSAVEGQDRPRRRRTRRSRPS